MKHVVRNLQNGFPEFQLLKIQAGLRGEKGDFQHL